MPDIKTAINKLHYLIEPYVFKQSMATAVML
jgi:hypothetical protein